jgi:hypothetical protein
MTDVRIFQGAMAVMLAIMAGLIVRSNLSHQAERETPPLSVYAQSAQLVPLVGALPPPRPGEPVPDPAHGPADVVRFQLEALRANNASDEGIVTCFRFASPQNQEQTGPLGRFTQIVKSPIYRPMLDYERADYAPIEVDRGNARQLVTLHDAEGHTATFVFLLAIQQHPAVRRCWMTEAVYRLPGPDDLPPAGAPPPESDGTRI